MNTTISPDDQQGPITSTPRSSGARRETLESAIFEQASRLFAERGYAGTTPQDIADAVGLSRQNLYYYVKSKEEILAKLVSEMTIRSVENVEEIAKEEGTPPDRVRNFTRSWVLDRAANRTRFRMLDRSESVLPAELSEQFLRGRRAALAALVGVIEEGIAGGWFRDVNPRVAALQIIGMCNWVAWWYEPGHEPEVDSIADQMADSAVVMISRVDRASADPRAVVDSIAGDLERLRALLPPS
ncbi:TetR/AcrR family transcriptional regulator [Rhodococcus wratislaviensis]|uniref:Putative TetR family transcriptional regulator n=1 Tax=Rhodococcus wratislaviensis NBRC 100605 TaxID=1219028 RepID=X0R659_RHOWR|nr:TetR/AcrR family transcriptional regulator [Rhodococcus wratislaviensis]GAF46435.1 putative TetR family transcriptional regulator [Rhodococcus wratislaviensis NBRC 100605]